MHICVFTTAHPWDDVRVKSKFVNSFLDAGDRVTWIGPDRNSFATPNARDGRVSYRLVEAARGWKGRLLSMWRLRQELSTVQDADWVYTPDPDATLLALTTRPQRIVFDIHEEYHKNHSLENLQEPIKKIAQTAIKVAMMAIVRGCTLTTSVNPQILRLYRANPSQSITTYNTPPKWFTRPNQPVVQRPDFAFFHGKAAGENGTGVVLKALTMLQNQDDHQTAVMMFPSRGAVDDAPYTPDFWKLIESSKTADQLRLLDAVAHRDMPKVMCSADIGLIAYNRQLGVGSLPNRFFEYMALGIPVIVPEYSVQLSAIVRDRAIGITADFEDPSSVARAMTWMCTHRDEAQLMGQRAGVAFAKEFSWEPIFDLFRNRMTQELQR